MTTPPLLRLGVMATSRKVDERRLPLHPAHLERIDEDLRANMILERGYGERFGIADAEPRAARRSDGLTATRSSPPPT